MECHDDEPERLRKLVRRDVVVVGFGTLIAIWTYSLVAAVAFGTLSKVTAGRAEVASGGGRVRVLCVVVGLGPRELMRDRMMVLIPGF